MSEPFDWHCELAGEAATEALGARLGPALRSGGLLTLAGELGVGKTTLARALLRALGITGRVRSPTYALLEPYTLPDLAIAHVDLYRLSDPDELEALGLRDWLKPGHLLLVEWPERAATALPRPDLAVRLEHVDPLRRRLQAKADGDLGQRWLDALRR